MASEGEWKRVGGATVHINAEGAIDKGCPGLVGHEADAEHLEATQDQRAAKQDAAEAAGWQSAESKEAEQLHGQAAKLAPEGTLVFVRIGDKLRTFGEHAGHAKQALGMGDGQEAEFDHEHMEKHLATLVKAGHRVAIVERAEEGQPRHQATVGPEHAGIIEPGEHGDEADPGRHPADQEPAPQPQPQWQRVKQDGRPFSEWDDHTATDIHEQLAREDGRTARIFGVQDNRHDNFAYYDDPWSNPWRETQTREGARKTAAAYLSRMAAQDNPALHAAASVTHAGATMNAARAMLAAGASKADVEILQSTAHPAVKSPAAARVMNAIDEEHQEAFAKDSLRKWAEIQFQLPDLPYSDRDQARDALFTIDNAINDAPEVWDYVWENLKEIRAEAGSYGREYVADRLAELATDAGRVADGSMPLDDLLFEHESYSPAIAQPEAAAAPPVPTQPTANPAREKAVKSLAKQAHTPQPMTQPRAAKGGQIGPNGEEYRAGAFIATTDMPKKIKDKLKATAQAGELVAPGVKELPPTGQLPIFARIGGTVYNHRDGSINEQYLGYIGATPEQVEGYKKLADALKRGEKYAPVSDFPYAAKFTDWARMIVDGQAIPEAALASVPENIRQYANKPQPPSPAQQPTAIKPGDTFPMPQVGDRPAQAMKIWSQGQDGTFSIGLASDEKDYGRVRVPAEAMPHFVADLSGKLNVPANSGVPEIDAVASGQGQWLGKGDDGIAWGVGDKVLKASTIIPFIPENYRGMMPDEAAARLKQQGAIQNELAAIHPAILPVQVHEHGGKSFLTMDRLQPIDHKNATPEQWNAVRDIYRAIHKAGYTLNDEPQFGLDAAGNVRMYDTGKARKVTAEPGSNVHNWAFQDDQDLLHIVAGRGGQNVKPWGAKAAANYNTWKHFRDSDTELDQGDYDEAVQSARDMTDDEHPEADAARAMMSAAAKRHGLADPFAPADSNSQPSQENKANPQVPEGEEPPPKPKKPRAPRQKHPAVEKAAEAAGDAPPKVRHLVEGLHKLDDVQATGQGSTTDLAPGYAEAMHKHLSGLVGRGDGYGQAHDLSDQLAPGAVGYHSPAGVTALVPPQFAGDPWEARYSAHVNEFGEEHGFGPDQGDAYEESDAYLQEREAKVKEQLEQITGQHNVHGPAFKAALEKAFPGDQERQLAAAEMAHQSWQDHADYMANLRRARDHFLDGMTGVETDTYDPKTGKRTTKNVRRTKKRLDEKQLSRGAIVQAAGRRGVMGRRNVESKDAKGDNAHKVYMTNQFWEDAGAENYGLYGKEWPEIFTPHKFDSVRGMLVPRGSGNASAGGVALDSELHQAFRENIGLTDEELQTAPPHVFVDEAADYIDSMGQRREEGDDEAVPFGRGAAMRYAKKRASRRQV